MEERVQSVQTKIMNSLRIVGDDGFTPVTALSNSFGHKATSLGIAYRCISLISSILARAEIRLVKEDDKGKKNLWKDPRALRLKQLLRKPDPRMSGSDFYLGLYGKLVGTNNSFAHIKRAANGEPVALLLAQSGEMQDDGTYNISISGTSGKTELLPKRDVIALHGPLFDGIRSPSPVQTVAKHSLELMSTALQRQKKDYDDGILGRFVFKFDDELSKLGAEELDEFVKAFHDQYQKAVSTKTVPVIPPGITPEIIGNVLAPVDQKILDLFGWTTEDVARIWGVPPALAGIGTAYKTGSDIEALFTVLDRQAVEGNVDIISTQFNEKLIIDDDRDAGSEIIVDTSGFHKGTVSQQIKKVEDLVSNAALLTPNEGRRLLQPLLGEDLPPLPGGDKLREARGNPPTPGRPNGSSNEEPEDE